VAGFPFADAHTGHGEGGPVHHAAADEQNLRQHEHDQDNGNDRATSQALADARNDRFGGHAADQETADGHDGAGGDDGRECKVHGLGNGAAVVHLGLQLLIAAGNDDGVVDVCAHLNGADDQVSQIEQVFARNGREGEVDPDSALDDQDQQDGHTGGLEGEQQHHQHDEHAQDADHGVIHGEGLLEVIFAGGVTGNVHVPIGIIASGNVQQGVRKGVSLVAADRQGQIDQHPAELGTLQLILGAEHLGLSVLQGLGLVLAEGDDARIDLVADVEHHVNERHLVSRKLSGQLTVVLLIGGVGGVDHLGHLIIQSRQFRKLPGGQLVGQHIAVHGLDVGQAHGVVHFLVALDLGKHFPFLVEIPRRDHQSHHVGGPKVVLDHLLGDLGVVQLRGGQDAVTVSVGALRGKLEGKHNEHHEHHRHHMGGIVDMPHEGDFRHEAPVAGLFDQRTKEHQQARHHQEGGQQGEGNGLDKTDGHIRAKLELHEQHGHQAADRGQAAGADFRDGLGQSRNNGLPDGQQPVFFLEPVAENDGIVNGQGQLQNTGHGVGHEGDFAQ